MKRFLCILVGFVLIRSLVFAQQPFSVADVFTDHMVLQRNAKIKLWGSTGAYSSVEITFNGQKVNAEIAGGAWKATFKPMSHGGPYDMVVRSGNEVKTIKDIYVGDVWLAGGQSNMEFALRRVKDAQQEISKADYPQIRYYKVPRKFYSGHQVNAEGWKVCSPATASELSAVAYYFARDIYKELNIPVGIIQTPVGGTTAEAWMSRSTLESCKDFKPVLEQYDSIVNSYNGRYETIYDEFKQNLTAYNKLTPEQRKGKVKPAEPMGEYDFHRPVGLFENMLATVMPYTLKGFIFYQGESNTGRGVQYRTLFPALIKEWRTCWGQGDIPFLFIQLPRFETKTRHWAELREAQYLTSQTVKNTGMAVAFDQGNPKDIHPIVKDTVGWRLSQLALAKVYGKKRVHQGPEFKKMSRTKEGVCIEFKNTGSGLVIKDGATHVTGFCVAGSDGQFHPASATLKGNKVLLVCELVPAPKHVRYLWMNSTDMNLFNKEGFPACPFRTDTFRLYTFQRNH